MAPRPDQQIERLLDEALKQNRFQGLDDFLHDKNNVGAPSKCSKQFMNKLDKFMTRELEQKHVKNACLGLTILHTFGSCLVFSGGEGLPGIVSQGIVGKWFEIAWCLWMEDRAHANEITLHLAEDFFDTLMAIHDSGKDGTSQVTETFLTLIGKLASDSLVDVSVQKEAVQKLNVILDAMPSELRKERKILSQEVSDVIKELAGRIVDCGDYDLQAAMLEAIYRMTVASQRREFVHRWFTMDFVASAFLKIREPQFETDCRTFLNMINGMKGDRRRVYSYPCLGVFLDKHKLLMPSDERLEEFWIDFNVGSQSISFYCSLASDETQEPSSTWETFFLPKNEVENYSVYEQGGKKTLDVLLNSSRSLGEISGSRLSISFSSSLDILQAVQKVFGSAKSQRFVGKKGTSVVKTTVQIILDETSSQVLIQDSQVPLSQRSERELPALSTSTILKPLPPNVPLQDSISKRSYHLPQSVTPVRPKISESSTLISSSSGRKLGGSPYTVVLPSSTPRGKVKPALQMVSSVERKHELSLRQMVAVKTSSSKKLLPELQDTSKEQPSIQASVPHRIANPRSDPKKGHEAEKFRRCIPVDKVLELVQTEEPCAAAEPLDESIVPDSQPTNRNEGSILPGVWSSEFYKQKTSLCNSVGSVQKNNSLLAAPKPDGLPKPAASLVEQPLPQQWRPPSAQRSSKEVSQRELHTQLTQKLEALVREREQDTEAKEALTGTSGFSRSQTPSRAGAGVPGTGKARTVPGMMPDPKPVKATSAKGRSEKMTNNNTKPAPSNVTNGKPDQGSAAQEKKSKEMTENMLRFISSHYPGTGCVSANDSGLLLASASKKRSVFDQSWTLNSSVRGDRNGSGFFKSFEMSKKTDLKDDVYAFDMSTPSNTGKNVKKTSEKSVLESSAISSSFTLSVSAKKAPPEKVAGRQVKKHLFSDTDTDRDKDTTTDVSWLRDSARRSKPKVADYSRQPAKICPPPCVSDVSPDMPAPSPKPAKEQAKPKRKRTQKKPMEEKPVAAKPVPTARDTAAAAKASTAAAGANGRRPRRAAAIDISYREASEDDLSENEEPPVPPTKKCRTSVPPAVPDRWQPELEAKKLKEKPKPAKALQESWASRVVSSHLSPPPKEMMRSAGKSPPVVMSPTTPLLPLRLSPVACPSLSPSIELPKPMMGIQASSFYKPKGSKDKEKTLSLDTPALPTPIGRTPSISSCRRSCASERPPLGPINSLHSPAQPLLTSTALEKSPEGSLLKSADLDQQLQEFAKVHKGRLELSDKDSVITMATLSQSSHLSVNNVAILCAEIEKTPAINKERAESEQILQSGPSYDPPHHPSEFNSSHSYGEREDEDENDREDEDTKWRAPRNKALKMKPRKLFKEKGKAWPKQPAQDESSTEEEEEKEEEEEHVSDMRGKKRAMKTTKKSYYSSHGESSSTVENMEVEMSHMVSRSSSTWKTGLEGELDVDVTHTEMSTSQEMGYVYQEVSTQLSRKFQERSEKMELYTKQSLKTVQQHMSSVSLQICKHRKQRLEKVKQALLEEIGNLEQDDNALKSMKKELTIYWKKQSLAFHSYREKESHRLQHLKNTFQTNVCPSLEYEQQIISSEICLMKKDMKSVQDKFLQEMREEELSSMRCGLHSLFMAGAPMF